MRIKFGWTILASFSINFYVQKTLYLFIYLFGGNVQMKRLSKSRGVLYEYQAHISPRRPFQ